MAAVSAALAAGTIGGGIALANATPSPAPPPPPPTSVVDTPEPGDTPDAPGASDVAEPGDTPDAPGAPDTDNAQDGDQGGPEVPDTSVTPAPPGR
ncbi:hypothetical protein [Mycolicibacterium hodleri]|uniref:hypothetical protein n=1 Tax=Mycolicibacterium hodleri TaxID=49897 RepID=UPI0021F2CA58|nr:hypothetical protein [Mycolicibacterium hodleri]